MLDPIAHLPRSTAPGTASVCWARLCHVLVAGPLALLCVLVAPGLVSAAELGSDRVEGCIDPMVLSATTMTPADPAGFISSDTRLLYPTSTWREAEAREVLDELFLHGMSCDGPSSCSPQLLGSAHADAQPTPGKPAPARGPMCSPSSPEHCNLSQGPAPNSPDLQMSQSHVPFLRRTEPLVPRSDSDSATDGATATRNARTQTLCPRTIVRRLERPPRG